MQFNYQIGNRAYGRDDILRHTFVTHLISLYKNSHFDIPGKYSSVKRLIAVIEDELYILIDSNVRERTDATSKYDSYVRYYVYVCLYRKETYVYTEGKRKKKTKTAFQELKRKIDCTFGILITHDEKNWRFYPDCKSVVSQIRSYHEPLPVLSYIFSTRSTRRNSSCARFTDFLARLFFLL